MAQNLGTSSESLLMPKQDKQFKDPRYAWETVEQTPGISSSLSCWLWVGQDEVGVKDSQIYLLKC